MSDELNRDKVIETIDATERRDDIAHLETIVSLAIFHRVSRRIKWVKHGESR